MTPYAMENGEFVKKPGQMTRLDFYKIMKKIMVGDKHDLRIDKSKLHLLEEKERKDVVKFLVRKKLPIMSELVQPDMLSFISEKNYIKKENLFIFDGGSNDQK